MSSPLAQFLGSLAAVVAIVAVASALRFRQFATLGSETEALELFRLAPGGFEPVAIALDHEGRSAIARDADSRIGVLVPHGNQFVFRLLPPGSAISLEQDRLAIRALPNVQIRPMGDASLWANTDSSDNNG